MSSKPKFDWRCTPIVIPRMRSLLQTLHAMDAARAELATQQRRLEHLLTARQLAGEFIPRSDAELIGLQQSWVAFQQQGGITEHDLECWLMEEPIPNRLKQPARSKHHLRIVANRVPRVRLRLDKPRPHNGGRGKGGDEAA